MTFNPLETPESRAMKQAHGLIKEKRYREARDILEDYDNPTARKWKARLDRLLLESDDPFTVAEHDSSQAVLRMTSRPRRDHQSRIAMWATIALIAGVIVIAVIYLVAVYLPGQDRQRIKDDLIYSCIQEGEAPASECDMLVDIMIDTIEALGKYDLLKDCLDRYDIHTEEGSEQVEECLEPLFDFEE